MSDNPLTEFVLRYRDDPVLFVKEVLGAVTTTLFGKRKSKYQSIAQDADVDFPVPCPDLTDILRSPLAMALRNSS